MADIKIKLSSNKGSSHIPAIYPKYTYNITTQKASVTWTVASGHFSYSYCEFGIQMRRKVNDKWKVTTTRIGGMSGANYEEKWHSGSATKTVKYGNNTQIRFVARCSANAEGGHCDAGWGSSWTGDTGWKKLNTETKDVVITLNDKDKNVNEYNNVVYDNTSKYPQQIIAHWTLEGTGCNRLVAAIYDSNDNLIKVLHSYNDPLTFSKATNSGNLTFTGLTSSTWYNIRIAVANTDLNEKLDADWEDDATVKAFMTREEAPEIYFKNGVTAGTSATVYFESVAPIKKTKHRLYCLAYTVHDDTTNKDVITNRYAFNEITSDKAVNNGHAYGTITITGLTAGHDYTVTPTKAITTSHGVSMARGYNTKITGAIAPKITNIFNVGSDLIFGEPNGDPSISVSISGTANVWHITLKIGFSISNNIVVNPILIKGASVGTNTYKLDDTALDAIYKTMAKDSTTKIYASIEYNLSATGTSGNHSATSKTMTLKGNAKTCRVGVAGVPRRAKIWIGRNGSAPARAVAWVGVAGEARRSL